MNIDFQTQKSLIEFRKEGSFEDIFEEYTKAAYSCIQKLDTVQLEILPFENEPYPECYIFVAPVLSNTFAAKNNTVKNNADFVVKQGDKMLATWKCDEENKITNLVIHDKIVFFAHMQEFFQWRIANIQEFLDS